MAQTRLSPHSTNATTRTVTEPRAARGHRLLGHGDDLASTATAMRYLVERFLGEGGFGQVYLARRLGRSATVPASLCIKVSARMDGWVREAYFGQLLDDNPRAIRVYDAFPVVHDGRILYCLAMEFARHGDLSAYLHRTGKQWPERVARREIAGILQVLGRLHRGQTLHRDLTPMNVFVCDGGRLKLGDFGIARQQGDKRGITTRTLNRQMAPSDFAARVIAPKWQARDDVYQVGQLLAMLVKGNAQARIRAAEVRKLPCSDQLKEIIYRCIGERRKRYESADELIEALSHPPAALKAGAVRSLAKVHVAFTGIFSKVRRDLLKAARGAGAVVHGMPSIKTTVVVRGRPNALQAAGRDGGRKLLEIKRLREKGHRITLITEAQFWRLAGKARR
ncbi:MAG: protein kinase [Vicinamibacterales bacterium]